MTVSPRLRSNSFNLVPFRDIERPPKTRCPLLGASKPERPEREVIVRLRDRMRCFRTTTSDFSDDEIRTTKHVHGQLYVDVSRKRAPDDFARDLRKLSLLAECEACVERAECPGCYRGSRTGAFERDDARVRGRLRQLTGQVVDVGCGAGDYVAEMADAAIVGRLQYTGIEPDAARVQVLQSRFPWARFFVGTLEEWLGDVDDELDCVLVLRSFNHLVDPKASLGSLARRLRPGGTLLVVDNVAYGLLRSDAQAMTAEAGPAEFEHYRNASATEARAVLDLEAFECVRFEEVTPESSNQWSMEFRSRRTDAQQKVTQ